eukprot:TRINITY_DN18524_c0_g2_i1.p1 TRINITY_DN18524_c0_g2~~TRINITY_DN18524_c0_g2_i1.p1  ORF type:complete len:286 (+),score=38.92 TRINITY_DN18524_c0_g2_i1:106-963(+)
MPPVMGDDELKQQIEAIKKKSQGGGMQVEEYFYWMKYVRDHAPQRLLVWGLGFDSVLLSTLNAGGTTAFLEGNADWVKKTDNKDLNYKSYNPDTFRTTVPTWYDFLKHPHASPLPQQFGVDCWDTILVDAPTGYRPRGCDDCAGRAVPIYTAREDVIKCLEAGKYASEQVVSIFVHDNNRPAEAGLTTVILGTPIKELGKKKLRHFVFKDPQAPATAVLYPKVVDPLALPLSGYVWVVLFVAVALTGWLVFHCVRSRSRDASKVPYKPVLKDSEPAALGKSQQKG